MKKLLIAGLTAFAFASTALAGTWDAYDRVLSDLEDQGYTETVRAVKGSLAEGQEARWVFRGLAGDAYAAFAVGDEDVSGLSVRVYDQAGRLVDADEGEGQGRPLVTFGAAHTQTYTVEVEMQECDDTVCAYRLGIARDDL